MGTGAFWHVEDGVRSGLANKEAVTPMMAVGPSPVPPTINNAKKPIFPFALFLLRVRKTNGLFFVSETWLTHRWNLRSRLRSLSLRKDRTNASETDMNRQNAISTKRLVILSQCTVFRKLTSRNNRAEPSAFIYRVWRIGNELVRQRNVSIAGCFSVSDSWTCAVLFLFYYGCMTQKRVIG